MQPKPIHELTYYTYTKQRLIWLSPVTNDAMQFCHLLDSYGHLMFFPPHKFQLHVYDNYDFADVEQWIIENGGFNSESG